MTESARKEVTKGFKEQSKTSKAFQQAHQKHAGANEKLKRAEDAYQAGLSISTAMTSFNDGSRRKKEKKRLGSNAKSRNCKVFCQTWSE